MKSCPSCGREIEDAEIACSHCGHRFEAEESVLPADETIREAEAVQADSAGPDDAAPAQAPAAPDVAPPVTRPGSWQLAAVGIAAFVVGVVALPLLSRSTVPPQDGPMSAASPPAPDTAGMSRPSTSTDTPSASYSAPRWRSGAQLVRAGGGSGTTAFELESENAVPVWMKRVRPTLGVRCRAAETEVFVAIDWPASLEGDEDRHTVRISFDDGVEIEEQWSDSVDKHALFAPDGAALARRLAQARRMRFAFTPFNAAPAVAEFDVRGFDKLAASAPRRCRWTT